MASSKKTSKKDRVKQLATYAEEKYGRSASRKKLAVLDQLVASLMSRRSSHARATRCIERMHKEFVDWNEVRVSAVTQISLTIGRNDWTQDVAQEIRELLETLYATQHEVSLDFLLEYTPTQIRSYLMKLPNVDRPTADEVMLLSLDIPSLPYGESQALTFHRLGLVSDERVTVTNQRSIEKLFEPETLPYIHFLLADHAGAVCLPDFGKCEECPFIDFCPSKPSKSRRRPASNGNGGSKKSGSRKTKAN